MPREPGSSAPTVSEGWPTGCSRPSSRSTCRWRLLTCSARPVPSRVTGPGPSSVVTRGCRGSSSRLPSSPAWPRPASTCCDLGVLPTPGVAHLTSALGRRPRRDDLRQSQPDARQRHQVPRPRRASSSTTTSSTSSRAASREPWDRPTGAEGRADLRLRHGGRRVRRAPRRDRCRTASSASRSSSTAPTAPPTRPAPGPCAPPAPTWSRSAPSPTAATSTTGAARPTWRSSRPPCSSTAPTPASRSTATPTAASPWTRPGEVVDGDQILAVLALALRDAGRLRRTRSWPRS